MLNAAILVVVHQKILVVEHQEILVFEQQRLDNLFFCVGASAAASAPCRRRRDAGVDAGVVGGGVRSVICPLFAAYFGVAGLITGPP